MNKDRDKQSNEQELNSTTEAVEMINADAESSNPVLDDLLKKRKAKRFLVFILMIIALAILVFTMPIKKGEVQRKYKAYDVINNKEITVQLNIWQEHKLLGKNEINGHITLYKLDDESKQKSLMFTGESAYDIYIQNRELQNTKLPKTGSRTDRIEAALEANSKIVDDEVQVKSRYSYLYADKGLENLILLGDAEKAEHDLFIIVKKYDTISNFEIISKMRETIELHPEDAQFMNYILAKNDQMLK